MAPTQLLLARPSGAVALVVSFHAVLLSKEDLRFELPSLILLTLFLEGYRRSAKRVDFYPLGALKLLPVVEGVLGKQYCRLANRPVASIVICLQIVLLLGVRFLDLRLIEIRFVRVLCLSRFELPSFRVEVVLDLRGIAFTQLVLGGLVELTEFLVGRRWHRCVPQALPMRAVSSASRYANALRTLAGLVLVATTSATSR